MILSLVLKREIGEISFTPQKTVTGISEDSHGIRMDAYITEQLSEDGENRPFIKVYDIEPDNQSGKKKWLPRRSRYYGDLIDVHLLNSGVDYDRLPELITIFILSYDPFGMNDMCYEVGSVIKGRPDTPYDDGIRRIYLYVDGNLPDNAGEDEKKLKNLLRYIGKSTAENVTDYITGRLDDMVRQTKLKKGVGIRYMKSWERDKALIERVTEEVTEKVTRQVTEQVTEQVKKSELAKLDAERKRADEAEAELAKYRKKYGDIA